jgi:hypothetical protein
MAGLATESLQWVHPEARLVNLEFLVFAQTSVIPSCLEPGREWRKWKSRDGRLVRTVGAVKDQTFLEA